MCLASCTQDGVPGSFHTAGSPHQGSECSPSSSRTISLSQGTACPLTRFAPSWLAGLPQLSLGVVYLVTWNKITWVVVFFSTSCAHSQPICCWGDLCLTAQEDTTSLLRGDPEGWVSGGHTERELLFRNNMICDLFKLLLFVSDFYFMYITII